MASGGYMDAEALIRYVKDGGHLNKTLSAICAAEGVGKNGVKSELQNRIIESKSHQFGSMLCSRRLPVAFI